MRSSTNKLTSWGWSRIPIGQICAVLAALVCWLPAVGGANAAVISEADLKARIEAATKDLKDLSMTANVVEVDRRAMEKLDANYTRMLELKSAKITLKLPDKVKVDGKLGMVRFEYIINGTIKISRAPAIRFKQRNDYTGDPAKLQGPFDMGIVTTSLWQNRKIGVLDDPTAAANGEIKLRLQWLKGDMVYYAWLDEKNLWLKRVEKYDSRGSLRAKSVYSNARNLGGSIWAPTTVELFAPDGSRAGKTEMVDIKYNSGVQDSLFQ